MDRAAMSSVQACAQATLAEHVLALRDLDHQIEITGAKITRAQTAATLPKLGPRENVVLHHLARGLSNKKIGAAAGISESTVKVHVKAILKKLGAENRTQAALLAVTAGIGGLRTPLQHLEAERDRLLLIRDKHAAVRDMALAAIEAAKLDAAAMPAVEPKAA